MQTRIQKERKNRREIRKQWHKIQVCSSPNDDGDDVLMHSIDWIRHLVEHNLLYLFIQAELHWCSAFTLWILILFVLAHSTAFRLGTKCMVCIRTHISNRVDGHKTIHTRARSLLGSRVSVISRVDTISSETRQERGGEDKKHVSLLQRTWFDFDTNNSLNAFSNFILNKLSKH